MTLVHDEGGSVLGGVGDDADLPLIDAARLHELRGCEAIADVPLPDGSLPITGRWRMTQDQWTRYRAMCAQAESWTPPAAAPVPLPSCCACPLLALTGDFAPLPEWLVWPVLLVITACALGWVALADVGDFYANYDDDEERR